MTREARQIIAMMNEYEKRKQVATPYVMALVEKIKRGEHKNFEPWSENA